MKYTRALLMTLAALIMLSTGASATFNYFQGFEVNTVDWVAAQAITRVPSGGGSLHLVPSAGSYYAELQNLPDGYGYPGYGDGGFSRYGGSDPVYHGDFFQAIDVYIDANWAPAAAGYDPSFWIDMTPYHADPNNYGAEHNFRVKALGGSVIVTVDGQTTPIATITSSGWYTFAMTWRKAANPADPVITDMNIYNHSQNLVGTTQVFATSPGGPFASSDLRGNGYVWITLWQNGFAGNVLAIDNQRTGLLPVFSKWGGELYIAIVDNDFLTADPFYFSPKHRQFLFDQSSTGIAHASPVCSGTFPPVGQYTRVGDAGCEQFLSQTPNNQAEVCDATTQGLGLKNAKTPAGNSGFYEWWIRLPEKPSGEINIVIQCGVLKPGAYAAYHNRAIDLCAAETGERIGAGVCVRQEVDPGISPVFSIALPKIKAIAYPGPYNDFTPFNLTAFKNPSSYTLAFDAVTAAMSNNTNSQVLDGSTNARILLKACMDKPVVTKLPVTGQINALGQTETDLEPGDLIYIRMDVPRQNTVDIYCHAQSARLMGIGESPF